MKRVFFVLVLLSWFGCGDSQNRPSLENLEYLGNDGDNLYFHLEFYDPDGDLYRGVLYIVVDKGDQPNTEGREGNPESLTLNLSDLFDMEGFIESTDRGHIFLRVSAEDLNLTREAGVKDNTMVSLKFFLKDEMDNMSNQAYVSLKLLYRE